jgi:hypothetical protein
VDQILQPVEVANPWRRAAVLAALVAAVELVALVLLALVALGKPLARSLHHAAVVTARSAPAARPTPAPPPPPVPHVARRTRAQTSILVLNGNGRQGAAAAEAQRLRGLGYRVRGARNAARSDYATSIVMFRPGYRPEAIRLAHDLGVRVVTPLDGLAPSQLHGAQLALILGT